MSLERTLEKIDPNYVIMYHNNATAIRQIEVFEARRRRNAADRIKVFSLIHGATIEEQMYLTELKREKNAFDMIIETKSVRFYFLVSFCALLPHLVWENPFA